jgi:hypothetical protein
MNDNDLMKTYKRTITVLWVVIATLFLLFFVAVCYL